MTAGGTVAPGVLSGRLQFDVTGGPEGGVSSHVTLEDGRLVACGGGGVDGPDLTLTLDWADAVALQRGDLEPSVAFMQGRMKVSGSMDMLLVLLAEAATPEGRDLIRRIAEITEF